MHISWSWNAIKRHARIVTKKTEKQKEERMNVLYTKKELKRVLEEIKNKQVKT